MNDTHPETPKVFFRKLSNQHHQRSLDILDQMKIRRIRRDLSNSTIDVLLITYETPKLLSQVSIVVQDSQIFTIIHYIRSDEPVTMINSHTNPSCSDDILISEENASMGSNIGLSGIYAFQLKTDDCMPNGKILICYHKMLGKFFHIYSKCPCMYSQEA